MAVVTGSLVTVILQFKDTTGSVAALLHNASLPYQLGMIFKCKVGHLSFLGRIWRKETWKNTTMGENPDISLGLYKGPT